MSKNLFESHIVYNPTEISLVRQAAIDNKFSLSFITGDEDLGNIKLLYLTKRGSSYDQLLSELKSLIAKDGMPLPIRYKIKVTLLDVLKPERVIKESVQSPAEHVEVRTGENSADKRTVCETAS